MVDGTSDLESTLGALDKVAQELVSTSPEDTPSGTTVGGAPSSGTGTGFNDVDAAKLLLDGWKFRVAHAWSSLTRYYAFAMFISAVPHLIPPNRLATFGSASYAFAIIGFVAGIGAIWLYGAEYARAQNQNRFYRDILRKYGHFEEDSLEDQWNKVFLKPAIGRATIYGLAAATFALSALNAYLIFRLLNPAGAQ